MLDNAPCHKAQLTRSWADANGVQLFFQPAYSPDVQPQENIWSLMKTRVERPVPRARKIRAHSRILRLEREVLRPENLVQSQLCA